MNIPLVIVVFIVVVDFVVEIVVLVAVVVGAEFIVVVIVVEVARVVSVKTSLLFSSVDSTTTSTEADVHKRKNAKMTNLITFDFFEVLPVIRNIIQVGTYHFGHWNIV